MLKVCVVVCAAWMQILKSHSKNVEYFSERKSWTKLWSLKGKNVLIVDDFHEMRSLTKSMLTPFSPELVKVAKDGPQAISLLEECSFDIILCDYNLGAGKMVNRSWKKQDIDPC